MPPTAAKRISPAAPHSNKAARALHRTAPNTTADLRGSADVPSIDEAGNGCIPTQQYWKAKAIRARQGRGDSHGGMRPLNGQRCSRHAAENAKRASRQAARQEANGRPTMPIVTW